jgi:hypothetical protein
MKCIKYNSGEVTRLKDGKAVEAVSKGDAVYVPKGEWRKTDPEWVKRQTNAKSSQEAAEKKKAAKDNPVL